MLPMSQCKRAPSSCLKSPTDGTRYEVQVLPDNAYERRSASAGPSQTELLSEQDPGSAINGAQGRNGDAKRQKQGLLPWVPPHKRDSEQGRVLRSGAVAD